jgi:hypothetical protein
LGEIDRLVESIEIACARHERNSGLFCDAPRPYPWLSDQGFRWTKEGPYWIAFGEADEGPILVGIFHDSADIGGRI